MMRKKSTILLFITIALAAYGGLQWALNLYAQRQLFGELTIDKKALAEDKRVFEIDDFRVTLSREPAQLHIAHNRAPEHTVWRSIPGQSFVQGAQGKAEVHEARGSFFVDNELINRCSRQYIKELSFIDNRLELSGYLQCQDGRADYSFVLKPYTAQQLSFELHFDDKKYNRAYLTYASDPQEHFFGFGEQFTYFDLKGKRIPILVMEQGIGRGLEPITTGADLTADSGGDWHTSYAGVPHYITSRMRSLYLRNYEYNVFDLRRENRVQVFAFSDKLSGNIVFGQSPKELIKEYTYYAGRMKPLPGWLTRGAVVGMQGGTQKVYNIYKQLKRRGTELSGFWLQDWVGQRKTSFGKQLWWNWELDKDRYPEWNKMVSFLRQKDIRVLSYINPFLADVSDKDNARQNLFQIAKNKGYLVRNQKGEPYMLQNTSFSSGLLDLTNPGARKWVKGIIKKNLIESGVGGWMADFGEALPFDAELYGDVEPSSYHNRYPEEWARINRQAIREAGKEDELVFFHRSGYSRSPRYARLFWLGDQLVTWDQYDGIKTAVTGLLSGGISGYSLNHSDIGGYTTITNPIKNYYRSQELLLRWMELNAFTTVFRSHEGNIPEKNVQIYSNTTTLKHFSRFSQVYAAWHFYRKELMQEAAKTGMPVVRALFLHYPDDPKTYSITSREFLVGSELLVAPVLNPEQQKVSVYLPQGRWVHVWSGREYGGDGSGREVSVKAPLGKPAVFYKKGSQVGKRFVANLKQRGLL